MIKLLHTADFHFGKVSNVDIDVQHPDFTDPINIRLSDTFDRFDTMIDYSIENDIDYFIIAGDLYDRPTVKNAIKKSVAKRVKRLIDNGVAVIIVVGNHDTDGDTSALSELAILVDGNKMLKVIDKPKIVRKQDIDFYCVPYFVGIEKKLDDVLSKLTEKRDFKKPMVGISHLAVSGCRVGPTEVPLTAKTQPEQLAGFVYVGLGDFHIYQKVGEGTRVGNGNRIYYSGSPLRLNMGEPEKKYFNVVSIEEGDLGFPKDIEQIELPDRQYISGSMSYQLMVKKFKKLESSGKIAIGSKIVKKGSVVKLNCDCIRALSAKAYKLGELMSKQLHELGVLSVDIKWTFAKKAIRDDSFDATTSIEDAINTRIENNPPKKFSKVAAKRSAKEMLDSVRS